MSQSAVEIIAASEVGAPHAPFAGLPVADDPMADIRALAGQVAVAKQAAQDRKQDAQFAHVERLRRATVAVDRLTPNVGSLLDELRAAVIDAGTAIVAKYQIAKFEGLAQMQVAIEGAKLVLIPGHPAGWDVRVEDRAKDDLTACPSHLENDDAALAFLVDLAIRELTRRLQELEEAYR